MDLLSVTPTAGTCYTRAAVDEGAHPPQRRSRLLHELRQPHGSLRAGRARRLHRLGSAVRGVAGRAPLPRGVLVCGGPCATRRAGADGGGDHRLPVGLGRGPVDGTGAPTAAGGAATGGRPRRTRRSGGGVGGRHGGAALRLRCPHVGTALERRAAAAGCAVSRARAHGAALPLYCLDAFAPPRPGLLRQEPGRAIEVEVGSCRSRPSALWSPGSPPRSRSGGSSSQAGEEVAGFLSEAHATEGARDITSHGGWRGYLAAGGGP